MCWQQQKSPLCGLHYTWGFSCEKYGGRKRVGDESRESRISINTLYAFISEPFPIIFNLKKPDPIMDFFDFFLET